MLNAVQRKRLSDEKNIWVATVRPDGRPHLTPVWFAWCDEKIYFCIMETAVKAGNLAKNPKIAIALEDGGSPIICEGYCYKVDLPWPLTVVEIFKKKYDWNILADEEYNLLLRMSPVKWLAW